MSERRYRWLKLQDGFFGSKRIKKMRKAKKGDTYVLIYLKMQLASVQSDGYLTYSGIESSFAEELALDLDENPADVAQTLKLLEAYGLIEASGENEYVLPFAVANIGSECDSAKRVRDLRTRKKQACNADVTECNADVTECNADVTNLLRACNVEVEEEVEKEEEKEEEGEVEVEGSVSSESALSDRQIADAIRLAVRDWNALSSLGIAPVSRIQSGSKRYSGIAARIREYGIANVCKAINSIRTSEFLRGHNKRSWVITFDWFILPGNFPKVLDGNYEDRKKGTEDWSWLEKEA